MLDLMGERDHLRICGCRQGDKARHIIRAFSAKVKALQNQGMEMGIQIQRTPEALQENNGPDLTVLDSLLARLAL